MYPIQDMDICSEAARLPSTMISYSLFFTKRLLQYYNQLLDYKNHNFPPIWTMRVKLCLYKNVLIMFVSKCKITLSLYHYCVASLPTDTIKIIITHFTIRYCKHTQPHTHYFKIDPALWIKSNFKNIISNGENTKRILFHWKSNLKS